MKISKSIYIFYKTATGYDFQFGNLCISFCTIIGGNWKWWSLKTRGRYSLNQCRLHIRWVGKQNE